MDMAKTLLLFLLVTTSLQSKDLYASGSCGCATETIVSFNAERIPSHITEWVCQHPVPTCVGVFYEVSCTFAHGYGPHQHCMYTANSLKKNLHKSVTNSLCLSRDFKKGLW